MNIIVVAEIAVLVILAVLVIIVCGSIGSRPSALVLVLFVFP